MSLQLIVSGHTDVDGEDVVGVGVEADTGDEDGADVEPAEGRVVDFRKGCSPLSVTAESDEARRPTTNRSTAPPWAAGAMSSLL